jgi:hypothetical protein
MPAHRHTARRSVPLTAGERDFDFVIERLSAVSDEVVRAHDVLGVPVADAVCCAVRKILATRTADEHEPTFLDG